MAPTRRLSNGRSPLVNQQSQITAFFSKASSSPSPSPSPVLPKQDPKPKPSLTPSRSPSPTTPSPVQTKLRKPLLVIGSSTTTSPSTPVTVSRSYGEEVLNRRIRIYWPLDKSWYEGSVKSFDDQTGKHLVQYDDADEETLDLGKEKIEWVKDKGRSLRRLRRGTVFEKAAVQVEEENVEESGSDDSNDEDWGKGKRMEEGEDDDTEDMEFDEGGYEEEGVDGPKKGQSKEVVPKKRKVAGDGKIDSGKRSKSSGKVEKNTFKESSVEPRKNADTTDRMASDIIDKALPGVLLERFAAREAEKLPFLGEDRKDAKRRRPGDANYDPRTLYLPPHFLKNLTGGQRQWWEFKSQHMDKVLFFKMGKFYELFEMDAHIGAKELDLQYMKGEQPHCGFPEKNFSINVEKLARKGYRVLVIEQTETPEQLGLRRKEEGSKDKVVKREICAVITKGTLTEGEILSTNPDASYLMAVTENCQFEERSFGVCVVDVATSRIILGQFKDDSECSTLCCLLTELRPVEIIKPASLLSPETERALMRHTRSPLVNELAPISEFWDSKKTVSELKNVYRCFNDPLVSGPLNEANMNVKDSFVGEDPVGLPDILSKLVDEGESGGLALSALGGTLFYLKQAFMDETLLRFAKFELFPCSGFGNIFHKPYMVLDSAALENLEIFENGGKGDSSGTLYAQLNHCVTGFGKRLLKTWLARPLYHLESIRERQDAVAGLRGVNLPFALEFRKEMSRLPDMERLLARLFASSEANGRNAKNVVFYEDAAKKQLQEFVSALRGCELMTQACSSLSVILENVESGLLHHLLTPGKGLSDIQLIIDHFKEAFDWTEANNSGRIIPHEGVDKEYDSACKTVKEIELRFKKHLKEQQKLLGDSSINFVAVGKETYLLEVPESLQGNIPRDYELRSSKKGFFRYWTPSIKKFLGELSHAESEKDSKLQSILQRLISRFCEHHNKWRQLVSSTAELDVLMSLAIAKDYYEGPTCQPVMSGSFNSNEVPCFAAKSLGHPVLQSDSLGKGTFVPNDITLGGSDHACFILLTGPNMGGKSTLLRQVCLAVILAQVGADVPAESLELSPVDCIFVRMGAKDNIMAGQSTFLTELSETASMLRSATCNSLVALDELGRGTSTSDGQAIAESVLEHFVHKVQCRGMFSTHYHRLSVDYKKNSKVSLCHMACKVGKGVEGVEEVTFLYRLKPGACPKSYGVNVARLAGLPSSVLQKAAAKSREIESIYGRHRKESNDGCDDRSSPQNSEDDIILLIQSLINSIAKMICDDDFKEIHAYSLSDLQQRARMLSSELNW